MSSTFQDKKSGGSRDVLLVYAAMFNAKIKVNFPRPICIALRKGVGKILITNVLYPPRVFGGADHIGPKHF